MDESILEEDGSSSSIFDSPFCFCLSMGIWLHPDLADELGSICVDQQFLLVDEILDDSCCRAFVVSRVSFSAFTPHLIEDGSFAEDLPRIPPKTISSC